MNEYEPLVTLIIPVYNVEQYLRQCLESAVSQSYRNLDILVVDDGSTDGSSEICDEFSALYSRITVFHMQNGGISSARNFGLDHMRKETQYVAFLDSDDWLELDAVQKLYDAIKQSTADIACGHYYREGIVRQSRILSLGNGETLEGDIILKHFLTGVGIGQVAWNKLYRADLFESIRYPVGRVFEDIATVYKAVALAGRVVILPDYHHHYRIRRNSISRGYSIKCLIDYWEAYYEQYISLSSLSSDPIVLQRLIGGCLLAINRMWRGYGGCNKEEKSQGKIIVEQMKEYAKEHRKAVLSESGYTIIEKLTCIIAATSNTYIMWFLNLLNKLYVLLRQKELFK